MLISETLRCGLQACAAQDDLWEVVGQVVVNYCEQQSIFFAADLGASCARIDWANWLDDVLFWPSKGFF